MKLLDIINETYSREDIIKVHKKAKLIFDLLKTGKYTVDGLTYKYVLPDAYWINIDDETGNPIIIATKNLNLYVIVTKPNGETYDHFVDRDHASIYSHAKQKIIKKFAEFNMGILP